LTLSSGVTVFSLLSGIVGIIRKRLLIVNGTRNASFTLYAAINVAYILYYEKHD